MAAVRPACLPCSTSTSRELLLPSLLKPKNNATTLAFNVINNNYYDYVALGKPSRRLFLVRSSSTDESDTSFPSPATVTATEDVEGDENSPVMEVQKEPPSLISALNVEKALRGIAITDVDHYGRLGLQMGCSYDQVRLAYQNKVNELSTQGLDEEEFNKQLELLKESYTILSSEDERRLYDWSLARSEKPDRYVWPFEVDITQTPKGTPPPPVYHLNSAWMLCTIVGTRGCRTDEIGGLLLFGLDCVSLHIVHRPQLVGKHMEGYMPMPTLVHFAFAWFM